MKGVELVYFLNKNVKIFARRLRTTRTRCDLPGTSALVLIDVEVGWQFC